MAANPTCAPARVLVAPAIPLADDRSVPFPVDPWSEDIRFEAPPGSVLRRLLRWVTVIGATVLAAIV